MTGRQKQTGEETLEKHVAMKQAATRLGSEIDNCAAVGCFVSLILVWLLYAAPGGSRIG